MSMKPPPPRFPADGHVTASARATATAASTALPPRLRMSTPTREAIGLVDVTIPCRACSGSGAAAYAVVERRRRTMSVFFMRGEVYRKRPRSTVLAPNRATRLLNGGGGYRNPVISTASRVTDRRATSSTLGDETSKLQI